MNAVAVQDESFFGATLKAVMVYDDFNFAAHAAALLEDAASRTGCGFRWDVKPWRLDILRQLSLVELAEAETVGADMVVFALAGIQFLPDDVVLWLERWAGRREIEDAAVMLIQSGWDAASAALANRLRLFAEARGLTFMGGHEMWPDGCRGPSLRLPPPLSTAEFPPVVEYPPSPDHWGLND